MGLWRAAFVIIQKDLLIELRGKEIFTATLLFAILTLLIFNFAFDMTAINGKDVAAGALWVSILFSGSVSMNRSFMSEKEDGRLEALMIAPLDRSCIYFAKLAGNMILAAISVVFIVPIFTVLFNMNVMEQFFWQSVTLFLGTLGFISVSTIISAMAVNLRAREMMGPLLMLPVVSPAMIAAVELSGGLIRGEPISDLAIWLKILIAFDVVYLVISWLVFDSIIEE